MSEEQPRNLGSARPIDLEPLIQKPSISREQLDDQAFERSDNLTVLPGHLITLAKSPVASRLLDIDNEIYHVAGDNIPAALWGCVSGEKLVDRIEGLEGQDRTNAFKIVVWLLEQELGQHDLNGIMEMLHDFPEKGNLRTYAKRTLWQFRAAAHAHKLFYEQYRDIGYAAAEPERYNRIKEILEASNFREQQKQFGQLLQQA